MIIAKIGNTTLKLDSMQDAETLLGIFVRSEPIDDTYLPGEGCKRVYVRDDRVRLSVEIAAETVHTQEAYAELCAKAEREKASKAAAKAGSTSTAGA